MQPEFWERLLCQKSHRMLSREHFRIDLCDKGEKFCLTNLSSISTMRVRSRCGENVSTIVGHVGTLTGEVRWLTKDQTCPLKHDDVITVFDGGDQVLRLGFWDLRFHARNTSLDIHHA